MFAFVYLYTDACVWICMHVCIHMCTCRDHGTTLGVIFRHVILFMWVGISQWFEAHQLYQSGPANKPQGLYCLSVFSDGIINMYYNTHIFNMGSKD